MFISLGMPSPALSHRFHTFLLANLTVLLPAAERRPGVGILRDGAAALWHEPPAGGGREGGGSPVPLHLVDGADRGLGDDSHAGRCLFGTGWDGSAMPVSQGDGARDKSTYNQSDGQSQPRGRPCACALLKHG